VPLYNLKGIAFSVRVFAFRPQESHLLARLALKVALKSPRSAGFVARSDFATP
jgi:hypothetical protein